MNTDTAVLAQQAANFQGIGVELKRVMTSVESTGADLTAVWHGAAGTAVQKALANFHVAAEQQRAALDQISESIGLSGTAYQATDEDQHAALLQTMTDYS